MSKKEFRDKVKKQVEKVALVRHEGGVLESEADYLAGAMLVMTIVNEMHFGASEEEAMDIVPPMWCIGPMSGRKLINNWE